MWIRLLGAPRWQRWLVHCCVAAVTFGLLAPLLMPDLMAGMAWPWRLVFLVGVSALFAQQAVIVGRRASHEYVAATRGLDRAERAQAIAASVRGDVPASAAVLVAAIRIAHLRLGFGRSTPNRIAVSYGLLTVSWLALTATNADGPGRMALKGLVAAFLAVTGVRGWLVARRVERRIILLQDASQRFPGAAAALRAAPRTEPASPRWRPTVALLTAVVLVTTGALAAVYLAHRQSPDCRTANDMARFVASHPDMLDPAFIPANSGGPTLADYQLWSEQLDRYAALSGGDVAPGLRSAAALSARATAVVREARADPADWQDPRQQRRRNDYATIAGELVTEVRALESHCPPRSSLLTRRT
ncbi:putative membrane protein [Mycobacterium avium MAV_120709_2344]|nr:hypothetical protein [Mycobacterium avium]ETZ54209.1 putative membrane protein [Mycobacterium avium MAV_120709_2344]KDO95758.1 hypothetical protein MAV3388_16815 [Mycobacterium avium subsp. hominissuis 3388]